MKPRKFVSSNVSSIEEHKLSNKKENCVKICKYRFCLSNYHFLYNQKGKVYLQRSKYLILPFVLESGLSITKSPQLPHLTFYGHKNSFLLVPDLIFIWSPLTKLEAFFSENPKKKMQIEATDVF